MKRAVFASLVVCVVACSGGNEGGADRDVDPTAGSGGSDVPSPSSSPGAQTSPPTETSPPQQQQPPAIDVANASCASAIPASAPHAPALPTYAGTCPALAAPPAFTTITSSGASRQFLAFKPATIAAGEVLPVVFLWHWLGGSPEDMGEALEVQNAVEARRFIAIVPAPKGDALFRWPFEASASQARVDEEARFFDDMLACVAAALPTNKECVSSVGVSAGALWTAQLAVARSERLASIVSLSGGVGGIVRPWSTTSHRLPALVLWGGPSDTYPDNVPIMNFETASKKLESSLAADGHFILECTHNCGHVVPPFDPPAAGGLGFDTIWRFVLDHPYWLGAAQSPYAAKGLPPAFPAWCAKGMASAVARTAACP